MLILICKLFLSFRIIITAVKAWLVVCTAMTQVNRLDLGFELWHIIPCRYSIPLRDGMWNEGVLETVLRSLGPSKLDTVSFAWGSGITFHQCMLIYVDFLVDNPVEQRQAGFCSSLFQLMLVTLSCLLYLLHTKRAALRWTASRSWMLSFVYGSHIGAAYSILGRRIDL